ncbi:MAG: hypothetical protein ACQEQZ_08445 [Pseudomonadota bacterium]
MLRRTLRQLQRVAKASSLVVSVLLLSACSQPHQPVNLAGNSWIGYQPFFISQSLYADRDRQTEFTIHPLPAASNVIRIMAAGQLDGGFLTLDEALVYQQGAQDSVCVAMVINESVGADAIVMKGDWRQRTEPLIIAHEATAGGRYMLSRARQHDAFAGKEVSGVVATFNRHAQMFTNDEIDGVVTFEPVLTQLRHSGATVIFDSADIAGEIIDVLVIKNSVWQQHSEHIDERLRFLWDRVIDDFKALSPPVRRLLTENTELKDNQLRQALGDINLIGAMNSDSFDLQTAVEPIQSLLLASDDLSKPQTLEYCQTGQANGK